MQYTTEQLAEILALHKKWLNDEEFEPREFEPREKSQFANRRRAYS